MYIFRGCDDWLWSRRNSRFFRSFNRINIVKLCDHWFWLPLDCLSWKVLSVCLSVPSSSSSIGGSKGALGMRVPLLAQFLSFSFSFWQTSSQIIGFWHKLKVWHHPVREILDPPLSSSSSSSLVLSVCLSVCLSEPPPSILHVFFSFDPLWLCSTNCTFCRSEC